MSLHTFILPCTCFLISQLFETSASDISLQKFFDRPCLDLNLIWKSTIGIRRYG